MAKDDKLKDLMRYDALQQEALRSVVKAALKRAASPEGLPGDHHFYISFRTDAPGVSGPKDLLAKYTDEMTIVLQNQFWDLATVVRFMTGNLGYQGLFSIETNGHDATRNIYNIVLDSILI